MAKGAKITASAARIRGRARSMNMQSIEFDRKGKAGKTCYLP